MFNGAVRKTDELKRILALPRRNPSPDELRKLAQEMTELLRREGLCPGKRDKNGLCDDPDCRSPLDLRTIQALALHDIGTYGGCFAPVGVGQGKTLITLLAPYILDAERPLLILPASLIRKTEISRAKLSKHWCIPENIEMVSYEILGRVQCASFLEQKNPDLIIADEAHKLKNKKAAVTKRVSRFMKEST